MVSEYGSALPYDTTDQGLTSRRCVQCGDIVDPVILQNRRLRQASTRLQSLAAPDHSREPRLAV
jgi:hypothetical protein